VFLADGTRRAAGLTRRTRAMLGIVCTTRSGSGDAGGVPVRRRALTSWVLGTRLFAPSALRNGASLGRPRQLLYGTVGCGSLREESGHCQPARLTLGPNMAQPAPGQKVCFCRRVQAPESRPCCKAAELRLLIKKIINTFLLAALQVLNHPRTLPMQTQNISSSTHHIESLDACIKY
jgi:hypothetical protein